MQYLTLLTTTGSQKIAAAAAAKTAIKLTKFVVGDGNGVAVMPNANQTSLVNKTFEASLSDLRVDSKNSSHMVAEGYIPSNQGNFWVREIGILDEDDDLICVGNIPETFKPIQSANVVKDLYIRIIFEVSSSSAVTLQVNPSIVLATKEFVNNEMAKKADLTHNHSEYLGKNDTSKDSEKLNGKAANYYLNGNNVRYKDFIVDGDDNKYYPVCIPRAEDDFAFSDYSISRAYNWSAPDSWNNASHKGGLTLTFKWTGDSSWGGNNKNIRIIEFNETYANILAGMELSVTGLIVYLRGGGAKYRLQGPKGVNEYPVVHINGFTDSDKKIYNPRINTNNLPREIFDRYPVRGTNGFNMEKIFNLSDNNTNGYMKFGDGTIVQWGKTATNINRVSFPIAFPRKCMLVLPVIQHRGTYVREDRNFVTTEDKTGFNVAAKQTTVALRYLAIGN